MQATTLQLTKVMTMVVAATGLALSSSHAWGQTTTTFSYQGELRQNGNLANGSFNMEFGLWNSPAGGTQLDVMTVNGVHVTDGKFLAQLDFGSTNFNLWNQNRWLQIKVNGSTLSPRTLISRSPYSLQTRGIRVNEDASFVGVGRDVGITNAEAFGIYKNTASFGGMYAETNEGGSPFYGYSTNGSVDAYHFFDGATGSWHLFNGGGVRMTVTEDGWVGLGTTDPTVRFKAESSTGAAVFGETQWGGALFTVAAGVIGRATNQAGNANTAGVYGLADSPQGRGVFGWATADSGFNIGVQGASNSTGGYDFYASGAGTNYGSSSSVRWKQNIKNIDEPLHKLSQLRGVYFDWDKEHGGHHDVGMIAEEVGKVLPEIVSYEENGVDASGMDYSKLTPLLVEAVNALATENKILHAAHQAQMTSLRAETIAKVNALQIELDQLRAIAEKNQSHQALIVSQLKPDPTKQLQQTIER